MHLALYRKWRPKTFADVYGQDHVTSVLRREVATGKISHAYLFCGSRGTGKTSCAKILAKAVNCENPQDGEPCGECPSCRLIDNGTATDVLELDAASNNGVENVRDIRDEVVYTPAALRRRVYIIDEVHMLSVAAFNALLKTLEEPPAHVVFILATTEPHKLPPTIISRCQRFDFRRIDNASIIKRLSEIASAEGIELEPGAASLIARLAQGGMRDAISTLELCAGDGAPVTEKKVRAVTGAADRGLLLAAVRAVQERDTEAIFNVIERAYEASTDVTVFWGDLVGLYRDMLVIKSTKNPRAYLDLTDSEFVAVAELARRIPAEALARQSELADEALVRMSRPGSQKRLVAELALVRMANPQFEADYSALLERVAALEAAVARLSAGAAAIAPQKGKPAVPAEGQGNTADLAGSPAPDDTDSPPWDVAADASGTAGGAETETHDEDVAAAESAPAPVPAAFVDTKQDAAGEGKPYGRWADVVERFRKDPIYEGEAAFLVQGSAAVSGDRFLVTLGCSSSMLGFLDRPDVKARLAGILSEFEGREISADDIKFITGAASPAPADNFEDFKL